MVPSLFRTVDDLYSLYVVVRNGDGKIGLQEISVPDEDIYTHRYIDIQEVMENSDSIEITEDNPLQISQLMMEKFRPGMPSTQFFALPGCAIYCDSDSSKYNDILWFKSGSSVCGEG